MHRLLQRALDAIEEATRGMTAEQLAWHPDGKWSAAQILEHLSLAFSSTSKALERALKAGRPATEVPTLRERAITAVVVEMGFFPSGRAAPEWTRPRGAPPETMVAMIREKLAEMDGRITECEQRYGVGIIARHPIIGPFSARQWRRFHWVHTRHHMKQIDRLRGMQASHTRN